MNGGQRGEEGRGKGRGEVEEVERERERDTGAYQSFILFFSLSSHGAGVCELFC